MSINIINDNIKNRHFSIDGYSIAHFDKKPNQLLFNTIINKTKNQGIKNILSNKNIDNKKVGKMLLQLSSEKNMIEKTSKKNLIFQIKKLLMEFEKEKNEKKKKFGGNSKNIKKKGEKQPQSKIKTKQVKNFSSFLVPQKKVYYITPKVKNQMQLNHYLINDFKVVGSEQAYVKRSLKYQKMNEDFDELVYLNQIKEAAKNGISEDVINEYEQKDNNELYDSGTKLGSCDFEVKSDNSIQTINKNNNKNEQKTIDERKRNSIYVNKNEYDSSLRKLYTEHFKENIIQKKISHRNSINTNIILIDSIPKNKNKNQSITSRTKNSENDNSIIDINDKNKTGIKFLIDRKNKNSSNSNTINVSENIMENFQKRIETKQNRRKRTKKMDKINVDKYIFSDRIYKAQKKEYNKYLKNKQIMRGKNFAKQMILLSKEKERYGFSDNDNDDDEGKGAPGGGGAPKLHFNKLLYQMQLKDIFTNSFNTMRLFREGDQDLDLDNLNKIKQLIRDYEIEMARVMKNSDNPNCIKKRFNKSTVGKYHSSRGIYM